MIDLTMGEDPSYHRSNGLRFLVDLIEAVKAETSLPVMISVGVVSKPVLTALAKAGGDWYACYQETHNRGCFVSCVLVRVIIFVFLQNTLLKKQAC